MDNKYIISAKLEEKDPKEDLDDFNRWYDRSILQKVIYEMEFAHQAIDEEFSTKSLDLQNSRCILDDTIEKLRAVDELTRFFNISRTYDDNLPLLF